MRIIAGRFKSRRLKATPPEGIRPTSDRLRETLFNVLAHKVADSIFLDGCAGMGGIGIEALSRGASQVYFVDQARKACRIIRENLQSLQVEEGYKILEMDLTRALDVFVRDGVVFDIAFVDPPYERADIYTRTLERFSQYPLLAADGILIVEHTKRAELPESEGGLQRVRSLVQGDSVLAFYRSEAG